MVNYIRKLSQLMLFVKLQVIQKWRITFEKSSTFEYEKSNEKNISKIIQIRMIECDNFVLFDMITNCNDNRHGSRI